MHFSALVVSMLATSATAYRHQGQWQGWQNWQKNQGQNQNQYEVVVTHYVTQVVTAGAPVPEKTYVPEQPQPVEAEPTTLRVIRKPKKTNAAPKATQPAAQPEPEEPAKEPSSGSGSGSGSSSGLTADQQGALDAHNKAREEVGNKPLTWDAELATGAQEWADHLASIGSLTHSQGGDGENLYMGTSENPFTDAVEAFLSEKSQYNGEAISGSNYQGFGHYTQCVWKTTTRVGMAVAKSGDGASYVVARYQEPGNMIGDTPY